MTGYWSAADCSFTVRVLEIKVEENTDYAESMEKSNDDGWFYDDDD